MKRGLKLIRNFIWLQMILVLLVISCYLTWPEQHKIIAIMGFVAFVPLVYMVVVGFMREYKWLKRLKS